MLRGQRHDQVPAGAGAQDLMGLLQMGVADAGGRRENRNVGEDIVEARSSVTDLIVCNGGRVTLVYCLLVISHSGCKILCHLSFASFQGGLIRSCCGRLHLSSSWRTSW